MIHLILGEEKALLCYGRIGGDTVLKIRKNQIRDKCQSDKYYASIKYMAHSLRGKDSLLF